MGCSQHVSDHAAETSVGATKGLDRARVVVSLALERERATSRKTDYSRVADKGAAHEVGVDRLCCFAQLVDERLTRDAILGRDCGAEGFVRAVLAPGLGNCLEFDIRRQASAPDEVVAHGLHLNWVEGQAASAIYLGQFGVGSSCRNRDELDWQMCTRDAREVVFDERRQNRFVNRPALDDRVTEKRGDQSIQVCLRERAANREALATGKPRDRHIHSDRKACKFVGCRVGDTGVQRSFDDRAGRGVVRQFACRNYVVAPCADLQQRVDQQRIDYFTIWRRYVAAHEDQICNGDLGY